MLKSLTALFLIGLFSWYAVGSVYVAMLMYWWFGIFRPQEWMWWDVSSLHLPLLAAVLFAGMALAKGYYPKATHPISKLILLYLVAVLISALNGCSSYESVNAAYVATLVLFILLTERVLQSPSSIWGLVFVAAVSLAYHSSKLSYHALIYGNTLYGIPVSRGSFSDGNSSALGASMGMFMFLFLISAIGSGTTATTPEWLSRNLTRRAIKGWILFLMLGSLVFVFKTESRGSALSLLLGLVIWFLLHPRKIRVTAAMSLIVVIVLSIGIPESYRERIASAFADTSELEDSAASRPHYWATAKLMVRDNPLGVGIGCFKSNYDAYDPSDGRYGRNRSVHSSHYSILAETGYIGFILWILLLLTTFATLFRIRSRSSSRRKDDAEQDFYFKLANAFIASMAVFVSGGNFYELAYNDYTWLLFAMTIAASRLQRQGLQRLT